MLPPSTWSLREAAGLVPIPTLAVLFVRLTLDPPSVHPDEPADELLIVTFFVAASNDTLVPPVPSNRIASLFVPAENCVVPAEFATFLKMFCAEPPSELLSVIVPPLPRVTGPPPLIP